MWSKLSPVGFGHEEADLFGRFPSLPEPRQGCAQKEKIMDWNTAPEDVLIHIFVQLNLHDLMSVSIVNHLWHDVARHNAIWAGVCRQWLPEQEIQDSSKISYYEQMKNFFFAWGKYKNFYQPLKSSLNTVQSVFTVKSPKLAQIFGPGLSEDGIPRILFINNRNHYVGN